MTKGELNKLKMLNATVSFLESNNEKVKQIVEFENSFNQFLEKVNEIRGIDPEFQRGLKAETSIKKIKKKELIISAKRCALIFYVCGVKNKLPELIVNLKVTETSLRVMPEISLIEKCNRILELSVQHKNLLEGTGFTEEVIENLRKSLREYIEAIEKWNLKRGRLRADRKRMSRLFKEIDFILKNEIDYFMMLYRKDKSFYEGYRASRKIIDYS